MFQRYYNVNNKSSLPVANSPSGKASIGKLLFLCANLGSNAMRNESEFEGKRPSEQIMNRVLRTFCECLFAAIDRGEFLFRGGYFNVSLINQSLKN